MSPSDRVPAYKYLAIWIEEKLSFKKHVDEIKKLIIKLGFVYRNRACLSLHCRKQIIQSTFIPVIDYGDIIYINAATSVLKPLDTSYHNKLHSITSDSFDTHIHHILYHKVGWTSQKTHRSLYYSVFVHKALLHELPIYLTSLLKYRNLHYNTRSQGWLMLETPHVSTELSKSTFSYQSLME